MANPLSFVLDQLEPYSECDAPTWGLIKAEIERVGLNNASKTAIEQIKLAKARYEKERLDKAQFGSRSEAGRYAASIRWMGNSSTMATEDGSIGAVAIRQRGAGLPTKRNDRRDYNALSPQQQGQYRARPVGMSHAEAMRRLADGTPLRERSGFRPATADEAETLGVASRWADVLVSKNPKGVNGTTAMGIDAKGRPQSLQSTEKKAEASLSKFNRIVELEKHMDKLDKRLAKDVAAGDEHAIALSLIRKAGVRPGSTNDTRGKVQAYGATTLQARHVTVRGKVITLDFIGKSGKRNLIKIKDPALAQAVEKLMVGKRNRDEVFPSVSSSTLLAYQRTIIPKKFLLKDLRTSLGTKTALDAMLKMPKPTTEQEFKKARTAVGKAVAEKLGNTPSVALSAYINPVVFEYWKVQQ